MWIQGQKAGNSALWRGENVPEEENAWTQGQKAGNSALWRGENVPEKENALA